MMLSRLEMAEIYQFNIARRNALVEMAHKNCSSPVQKLEFVVNYFLNNLPIEIIAEIDGVSPDKVLPFEYDYSFLQGNNEQFTRDQKVRPYAPGKYAISISHADNDVRVKPAIPIYPSVYTSKMATCIMFACEIQRFAVDFGLDMKIVNKFANCYDFYSGKTSENQPLSTDRIINMLHYFNVVTIDGKEYKIDVAGALTAADFNKNHPKQPIDLLKFYFNENIEENPFDGHTISQGEPSQPQKP